MKFALMIFTICLTQFALSAAKKQPTARRESKSLTLNQHLNRLSKTEREQLAAKYQAESCVNKSGLQVSCGFRTEWTNGDKSYNFDNYMNQIAPGTRVEIDIKCDEQQGKFYMDVKVPVKVCQTSRTGKRDPRTCRTQMKYFANPYDGDGDNRVLRDEPTRWLTSPGLYPDNRTDAQPDGLPKRTVGGRAVVSEYHVVSEKQEWAYAQMLYALWIKGGYAVHGSNSVDGYPGSGGCIRLEQLNAFALYNLARRVGPNNLAYNWHGYGRTNPKTGKPFCAGPPGHREKVLAQRKLISPEDNKSSLAALEEALWKQNRTEGRQLATLDEPDEPARSVNSVKEK